MQSQIEQSATHHAVQLTTCALAQAGADRFGCMDAELKITT